MTTKRRRTKGEGSITKMANGKYRVRLDCGYVDGKRKQLSGTADSLAEARVLLRGFMKLREEADVAVSMNMTFEALTKSFLEHRRTRTNMKETTLFHYKHNINTMLPFIGSKSLSKITTKDVDAYITALRNAGKKELTIKSYVRIMATIFNYAIKVLRIIAVNPVAGSLYIDSSKRKLDMDILSETEFTILRDVLKKEYEAYPTTHPNRKPNATSMLYIAFLLAYELGMREGEILGLRWSRIDFQKHTVYVDNQRVYTDEGDFDAPPKSRSSIRLLVVSEGLIKILAKHKATYQFSDKDDYVFSKDFNGTVIFKARTLLRTFQNWLVKVGITRHFTFHMLRHTNATRLIELTGNDYKTVSERLGHSSVSITFDVYAHTIKKQHQLAANLMDCTK